jgi:hypothetical protein
MRKASTRNSVLSFWQIIAKSIFLAKSIEHPGRKVRISRHFGGMSLPWSKPGSRNQITLRSEWLHPALGSRG